MRNVPPEATAGRGAVYTHRATRAVQKLVEFAPATGGLALWIHHQDVDDGKPAITAANDGKTIYYGAAFERLPLAEQMGLVAHQVLHVALRHPQRLLEMQRRLGDVDPQLYNICADAIINTTLGHLSWLTLPGGSVFLEDLLARALRIQQNAEQALLEWNLERLYRALDDRQQRGAGRGANAGNGRGQDQAQRGGRQSRSATQDNQAPQQADGHRAAQARLAGADIIVDLLPAAEAERPEAEAEQAREWAERISRAHTGDGAYSMLRALLADLPKVRTPWEHLLRTQLTRGLAQQPELSWSRPARSYLANRGRVGGTARALRMPWEPGISSTRAVARLALLVDVSGSIDELLLARFAQEIEAITRRLATRIVVIVGDMQVREVRVCEPGRSNLREIQFQGGGGTDFTPLLQTAERYSPDMAVFLTDLDGKLDHRPSYPVLWAVPAQYEYMPMPFGRKLVLD